MSSAVNWLKLKMYSDEYVHEAILTDPTLVSLYKAVCDISANAPKYYIWTSDGELIMKFPEREAKIIATLEGYIEERTKELYEHFRQ